MYVCMYHPSEILNKEIQLIEANEFHMKVVYLGHN